MLIIDKQSTWYPHMMDQLKEVLDVVARTHVSRSPVRVNLHGSNIATFTDDRFPDKAVLARLEVMRDMGMFVYSVESRRIKNDKYSLGSAGYHIKKSKNKTNILKLLKSELLQPYPHKEIMGWTSNTAVIQVREWVSQMERQFNTVCRDIENVDIIEELKWLHEMGVTFRSSAINKLVTEGIPIYEEYKYRKNSKRQHIHVLINTDGRVYTHNRNATQETEYASFDELPEDIRTNIALLRMHDKGSFVPEVGWRISDIEYWILVAPNNT